MSAKKRLKSRYQLQKRSSRGFQGYPVATIAYYGPTDSLATKVVVGIVQSEDQKQDAVLRKWFSEGENDVRFDVAATEEVVAFIEQSRAASVVMPGRIIGCPHEEGIDYPQGETCPFWANRDRWTGAVLKP